MSNNRNIQLSGFLNRNLEEPLEELHARIDEIEQLIDDASGDPELAGIYARLDELEVALAGFDPGGTGGETGDLAKRVADLAAIVDARGAELGDVRDRLQALEDRLDTWTVDPTRVRIGELCDPGEDIAAAIRDHCEAADQVAHEYVLDGERAHYWNSHLDASEIDYAHLSIRGEPQADITVGPDVSLLCRLSGPSHALRNLRVDIRGEDCDAGIARVSTTENGVFENLRLVGQRDKYGNNGDRHTLRTNAVRESATNTIRNVALPDGDTSHSDESRAGHAIAFSSESGHVGTNIFEGCYVEGFIDNAFYTAGGSGANLISGCRTKNIAGTHLRLGERDHAENFHGVQEHSPGGHAWTGLWAQTGSPTFSNVSITAAGTCERAGELLRDNSGGGMWRDVDVVDRRPIAMSRAIRIDTTGRTDFEGCSFTDRSAADGDYFCYLKGGNTHFEDCIFTIQTTGERGGILAYSDKINNCSFDSCEFTGQEHEAIRQRDNAIEWEARFNRFKPASRVVIPDGVMASEFTWIGNRHTGEDELGDRCSGWAGRGTNQGFAHPGDSGN